ncbi:alpha/beta hydrolase family protein [Sediminispirochaeta bajacaliforniensis]|uniref:alpha/beta hydrolase family protein n=1 Tax=Sediminispirochaeta bajacaliforniensis TaxID=148 RepID=UPI0003816DB9|nr:alpha/beta hydrolase [Sediminispirochaeta bajacaliforniensis]
MKQLRLFSIIIMVLFILSCSTIPYSGMEVISETEGYNYFIRNKESNSLIIYINGSGYKSVLGLQDHNHKWTETTLSNPLSQHFRDSYNILIPEKLDFSPGEIYLDNPEVLSKSTVQALGLSYSGKIDSFLRKNNFDEIILIGASEGGALLPFIYKNLEYKNEIDKMVIWSGGGLSQLEEFQILRDSSVEMPDQYRELCGQVIEMADTISKDPEAIDRYYLGHPYIRWSSFFEYEPIELIKDIKIPILFIHGELDWSTPVESTRIIEDSNISDLFDFYYYPKMEHGPSSFSELKKVLKDIETWLIG